MRVLESSQLSGYCGLCIRPSGEQPVAIDPNSDIGSGQGGIRVNLACFENPIFLDCVVLAAPPCGSDRLRHVPPLT